MEAWVPDTDTISRTINESPCFFFQFLSLVYIPLFCFTDYIIYVIMCMQITVFIIIRKLRRMGHIMLPYPLMLLLDHAVN